jgi:hypothetical protein
MDSAYKDDFKDLTVTVPCCGAKTSLNELMYVWPAGFALFSIEVYNPGKEISDEELDCLERILGTTVKMIWAHY